MAIYTRKGDTGQTGLSDGSRVSKSSLRIDALGAVDELNAALGLARSLAADPGVAEALAAIQRQLFIVGAELASPADEGRIDPDWVPAMERAIDAADAELAPQRGWILPGEGGPGAGALHLARTACRRAERAAVRVAAGPGPGDGPADPLTPVIRYLNRLSDYLHTLARLEAQRGLVRQIAGRVRAALNPAPGAPPAAVTPAPAAPDALPAPAAAAASGGLTDADCEQVLAAAVERARAVGVPMVIAVVDDGGNLKAFKRMDGALLISVDIAVGKAYTSAAIRLPTGHLAGLIQPGAPLYGIADAAGGRLVAFGGGLPIRRGGAVIGGLGVSGGTVEQDEEVAHAGLGGLEP